MKRNILIVLLVAVLIVPLIIHGACATTAPGEAVKLRFVSFLPNTPPNNIPDMYFINKVNEKAKGKLIVEHIGGPEAIAPPDAPVSVRNGTIEMARCLYTLVDSMAPGVECLSHNEISYAEVRKKAGDYIQSLFNKSGLYWLGYAAPVPIQAFLYLNANKRIGKPEDFAGMKISTPGPSPIPFFKALGATPVVIPLHEVFTAVERGVVDGFLLSLESVPGFGLHEVTKYCIDHPYTSCPDAIIVNPDKWNALPKDLQKILTESAIEHENEFPDVYLKEMANPGRQKMLDAGMEFLKFSDADAKRFHDMYKEASWSAMIGKNPEIATKLKGLIAQ